MNKPEQIIKWETEGSKIFEIFSSKKEIEYKQIYDNHQQLEASITKIDTDIENMQKAVKETPKKIKNANSQRDMYKIRLKDNDKFYERAVKILESKFRNFVKENKEEAIKSAKESKRDPAQSNDSHTYEMVAKARHFIMTKEEIAAEIPMKIMQKLLVDSDELLNKEDLK